MCIRDSRGTVKGLLNVNVHGAGNMADLVGQFLGDQVIALLICAGNFHIDGRGHAKIQNLRDDVRGLEEELHTGKFLWKFFAQISDVSAGRVLAIFL